MVAKPGKSKKQKKKVEKKNLFDAADKAMGYNVMSGDNVGDSDTTEAIEGMCILFSSLFFYSIKSLSF